MTLLCVCPSRPMNYRLQSNGMVERFHRKLKASLPISSSSSEKWKDTLTLTLDIRSVLKEDLQHSSAKLVYGTTLHLSGGILVASLHSHPVSFRTYQPTSKSHC